MTDLVWLCNKETSWEKDWIEYLFEGDHNYEPVLNDCRAYWNKVKIGGLFSGHDWNLDNVKNAVSKFRDEFNISTKIEFTNNNVWYWFKE